ncbi:hypothetical protein GY45DRAFT_1376877 [Cubamyces sp. BRFM 1775]|nr:hypothetical protein GY45DRAFT_1376877 [Cubamyces sp. BRFM 1775]
MSDIVIREVAPDVWTFSRPYTLLGLFPVGGRSTAIKLTSGGVWILASTPLTDETKQKLAELGDVKYIVAGNAFHHLFLKQYKDAYPTAKTLGPEDLNAKKAAEGWQLDAVFSAKTPDLKHGFEDEIEHCYFSGFGNKDVAFYHKASKTAIGADLLMNNPPKEQYSKSPLSPKSTLLSTMTPHGWQLRTFIWLKEKDKAAMIRDARKVYEWDFVRFIPCHGDVIETNAKEAWKAAFGRYLS